ncbi:MAG: hypothetical protein ACREL7_02525 [Longimicrobiales bacterium]
MPTPFTEKRAIRPTVVQRLLHRASVDGAIVELNNLLARCGVREVRAADIGAIFLRHRVRPTHLHPRHLERFYREYLLFCLADRRLSDDELADLEHLREILALDALAVDAIHRNVARQVYLRSVAEVLADGSIDVQERAFLSRLREQLGVPESIAENIEVMKERQYRNRNKDGR